MSIKVRQARPGDKFDIQALLRRAAYKLPPLWRWQEHLCDGLFVVIECQNLVVGGFLAWPDASPIAWVRVAALDDGLAVADWLDLVLPATLQKLRQKGVQKLAWMDYNGWAGPHLPARGFRRFKVITTLETTQHVLIELENALDVHLRPASMQDIPMIIRLDRAAFSPHWWYSASTLRRRYDVTSHFVVAEKADILVGYVEGETHMPRSHLNRIAVHPDCQGLGLGKLLLNDAMQAFWRQGSEYVTVNTQIDNHRALRLYRQFGFESIDDTVTAWERCC
ncbi:MAG TPA: N-acetyltransferase [Chloroflexi bacterium]|nr:N-acetyltransferase [Chloroflexota bacterium]